MNNAMPSIVKSADRVLDIFELLAAEQSPVSLMDAARKLDVPPSSLYKLLQNLLVRGYVAASGNGKLFSLGHRVFEVGSAYLRHSSLAIEFRQAAERIVEEINESVYLAVLDGRYVVYVSERMSLHPVRFVSHLGMKLPAHATALGKVLLSGLTGETLAALYEPEGPGSLTERTITSLDVLMSELDAIRRQGIGYSYGEAVEGVQCVAAPVYRQDGAIAAAISVSIPTTRLTDQLWSQALAAVRTASREISVKLAFLS